MPKYIEQLVDEQLRRATLANKAQPEDFTASEPIGPVITISRQLGSGGRKVAERLASILEWSLWDKELVEAIAQNASVRKKVVESFDERTISELEIMFRAAFGEHDLGGFIYHQHLARTLLAIAKHGSAIILGRGANFLVKDALNVRIHASEERRIENLMRFEGYSREEAIRAIKRTDRERAQFVKRMFGQDVADCRLYDLVIKTDDVFVEGAARIIITALRHKYPAFKMPVMSDAA